MKTTPNLEVCPESLGAMLEYWQIERGLFATFQNIEFPRGNYQIDSFET